MGTVEHEHRLIFELFFFVFFQYAWMPKIFKKELLFTTTFI